MRKNFGDDQSDSGRTELSSSEDDDSFIDEESAMAPPVPNWDVFEVKPPEVDSGSAAAMVWIKRFEVLMLLGAYVVTFFVVLLASIVSKGSTLFMIHQVSVKNSSRLPFCNEDRKVADVTKDYIVDRGRGGDPNAPNYEAKLEALETDQVAWVWVIIFAYACPEVIGTFLRSLRIVVLKTYKRPALADFIFVFIMETLHVAGLAVLVFLAFPQLDSAHAVVLTNCLAIIPSILLLMSRSKREGLIWLKTPIDVVAILSQLSGALAWPILQWTDHSQAQQNMEYPWALPLGLVLASCGWWETFVYSDSAFPVIRWMASVRQNMIGGTRYFTYLLLSLWKACCFFGLAWLITSLNGLLRQPLNLFHKFAASFDSHAFNVTEVMDFDIDDDINRSAYEPLLRAVLFTVKNSAVWVLLIQIGSSYLTYILAKFAAKVQIQGFSFALPLCAVVPCTATLLLAGCGARAADSCAFHNLMPDYLFFECPSVGDYFDYLWAEQVWLWAFWFISQIWITAHIWFPKSARLASTEQIFGTPMYCSLAIDQSIVLNRRPDGQEELKVDELKQEREEDIMTHYEHLAYSEQSETIGNSSSAKGSKKSRSVVKASDRVTKIYGCATMWHETIEEMMEMLKSLFRVDMDYSSRRLAQKYMDIVDPDFYEWETHILFDDAFELGDNDEEEQVVNAFVKDLVRIIDEAGSFVHCKKIKVKPPVRIPTPYGGRLVWTLPGKTKIVCHLKDKSKIRHKKRWSQCMYMYYLLGYKLMELPIADERKQAMAENTYILALDGDIDFQPEAVTRLVDLMKKNKNLGAACGRIHPTGSGFMVWYQKFEYAVGHWLQKATEHVLGCVLCSPGCFSLFRASALMDFNVMRMYTTKSELPMHFVQYDQGEDRWLCTLILQRGWRVEYSAASDAYTACPEGFNEFFNQRRRWMPSTIANIFDLLSDYKNVVKVNPDISMFYIGYQVMMMVGTVLGPGTIFMVLTGALNAAFGIANWTAFLYNLIPIMGFMIACFTLKSDTQLFLAQILAAAYALLMMAVMVGVVLQITVDGPLAPTSLMTFLTFGSFALAGILHPQEIGCLPYLLIYFITIPAMYLLLVIYSIFNLNVVSWGTREVPKKLSKQDLEEQKKQEEAMKKEALKKKKEGGLFGFLMQQSSGKSAEKGGLEFSLANLFKCMCFTHQDPEDSQKQLVKIATSLEDVATRLKKIETNVKGSSVSFEGNRGGSFKRHSSISRQLARTRMQSAAGLQSPLGSLVPPASTTTPTPAESEVLLVDHQDSSSSDDSDRLSINKPVRDDTVNPYWIEDRDLKNGKRDFLSGHETQFWKDLVAKYLLPIDKNAEKEAKQARDLISLRNQMVFSFFMLNALFVLIVFMLQEKKDIINVPWPLDPKQNISYVKDDNTGPRVEVAQEHLQLEPIGLVFLLFFGAVLIFQVIGMVLHRWGTASHIISTTKLDWCNKKTADETGDGTLDKKAIEFVSALQRDNTMQQTDAGGSQLINPARPQPLDRRGTVHQIAANMKEAREKGAANFDLEREFRDKFKKLSPDTFENSENPTLRRLSTKPEALRAFAHRRDSYFDGERRRSTIQRRLSSINKGSLNDGFEGDSAISADEYSASALSRNSQIVEFVEAEEDASSSSQSKR